MAANYRIPGTKEFKKMNHIKELMMDEDPIIRKQALIIFNKITKTEYDNIVEELEEEIEKREKVFRKIEKRKLIEASKEEAGVEIDRKKFPEKEDKNVIQEMASLNFKLKYYSELKDYEINANLNKTKVNL